jgi:hypothetical protein
MTPKKAAIEIIERLPENVTMPDILSELGQRDGMGGLSSLGLINEPNNVIAIRLPKSQRGKAWRAMIEIGPVRLVAKDPIYEVMPAHLKLLQNLGVSYEVVNRTPRRKGNHRRATSR